ncbi:MAG: hypothetical protein ACJ70W_06460, partial [Nitrososphaera sp.]
GSNSVVDFLSLQDLEYDIPHRLQLPLDPLGQAPRLQSVVMQSGLTKTNWFGLDEDENDESVWFDNDLFEDISSMSKMPSESPN